MHFSQRIPPSLMAKERMGAAQTYRGGADPTAVRGGFRMVYQLEGCPARTPALCATIGRTPDVHAWSLYCDWPGDAA